MNAILIFISLLLLIVAPVLAESERPHFGDLPASMSARDTIVVDGLTLRCVGCSVRRSANGCWVLSAESRAGIECATAIATLLKGMSLDRAGQSLPTDDELWQFSRKESNDPALRGQAILALAGRPAAEELFLEDPFTLVRDFPNLLRELFYQRPDWKRLWTKIWQEGVFDSDREQRRLWAALAVERIPREGEDELFGELWVRDLPHDRAFLQALIDETDSRAPLMTAAFQQTLRYLERCVGTERTDAGCEAIVDSVRLSVGARSYLDRVRSQDIIRQARECRWDDPDAVLSVLEALRALPTERRGASELKAVFAAVLAAAEQSIAVRQAIQSTEEYVELLRVAALGDADLEAQASSLSRHSSVRSNDTVADGNPMERSARDRAAASRFGPTVAALFALTGGLLLCTILVVRPVLVRQRNAKRALQERLDNLELQSILHYFEAERSESDELKRRFREKAKATHPDTATGSSQEHTSAFLHAKRLYDRGRELLAKRPSQA